MNIYNIPNINNNKTYMYKKYVNVDDNNIVNFEINKNNNNIISVYWKFNEDDSKITVNFDVDDSNLKDKLLDKNYYTKIERKLNLKNEYIDNNIWMRFFCENFNNKINLNIKFDKKYNNTIHFIENYKI
jgi:hypothetical protein